MTHARLHATPTRAHTASTAARPHENERSSAAGVPCRTHQQCVETIDRLSESASTDEEILCLVVPGGAAQPLPTPPDDDDAADDAARVEALGEADEDGGGGGCAIL